MKNISFVNISACRLIDMFAIKFPFISLINYRVVLWHFDAFESHYQTIRAFTGRAYSLYSQYRSWQFLERLAVERQHSSLNSFQKRRYHPFVVLIVTLYALSLAVYLQYQLLLEYPLKEETVLVILLATRSGWKQSALLKHGCYFAQQECYCGGWYLSLELFFAKTCVKSLFTVLSLKQDRAVCYLQCRHAYYFLFLHIFVTKLCVFGESKFCTGLHVCRNMLKNGG